MASNLVMEKVGVVLGPTNNNSIILKIMYVEDSQNQDCLLGTPSDKTSPSNAGDEGSIPGQGAKIPHASWPKK